MSDSEEPAPRASVEDALRKAASAGRSIALSPEHSAELIGVLDELRLQRAATAPLIAGLAKLVRTARIRWHVAERHAVTQDRNVELAEANRSRAEEDLARYKAARHDDYLRGMEVGAAPWVGTSHE